MARRATVRIDPLTPAPTSDRLITTRELTERTTLSRTTLWRMVQRHELPAPIRLTPTRIGWSERDITAWLNERRGA